MSKKSKAGQKNLARCRQALDSTLTQDEWDEIIVELGLMAKSSDPAVAVRAAELLLRYRFGPQGDSQTKRPDAPLD